MQTVPEEDTFRGYAGIIRNTLTVLNKSTIYRRWYGRAVRRFLCNSPQWRYAALIIMENGMVRVDAVANKPEANLLKAALKWDGFVEMDSSLFAALSFRFDEKMARRTNKTAWPVETLYFVGLVLHLEKSKRKWNVFWQSAGPMIEKTCA